MLNGFDFAGERVVFDWRTFNYYAPTADNLETVINLEHQPDLYPIIYGVKCKFPNGVELVLPENTTHTGVTWFFPFTKNLWRPAADMDRIYSMDESPNAFPPGCADSLVLTYPGENKIEL